jgi:hypothetical protein
MGTEIYIAIDGVQNTAIHTSCSNPIGPDMVFGDFKVVEGYSRNGGLLGGTNCPTDTTSVNYLASLNLVSPTPSTHIYVADNTLVFDEYYEANEGVATVALDSTVDFLSRLTFDVNQTAGLFMPYLAGDNGVYLTNDIRHTNRYGFMFPADKAMTELKFSTWGVGFTGVVSNLSLIEISDLNQSSISYADENVVCDEDKDHKKEKSHKKDKDNKKDSHKKCDKDHKKNKDHKKDSHKSCDRD